MKSLRLTEITFFIIGFVFLVLAVVTASSNQWLPFLTMGASFIVIGIAQVSESKKGDK